jgi:hypothetical protein
MSSKLTFPAIALLVFGGVAAVSTSFAQAPPATPPAPQGQGMMGGSGQMGDMMNMVGQMNRMMESCTKMMESANKSAPAKPSAPGQRG